MLGCICPFSIHGAFCAAALALTAIDTGKLVYLAMIDSLHGALALATLAGVTQVGQDVRAESFPQGFGQVEPPGPNYPQGGSIGTNIAAPGPGAKNGPG